MAHELFEHVNVTQTREQELTVVLFGHSLPAARCGSQNSTIVISMGISVRHQHTTRAFGVTRWLGACSSDEWQQTSAMTGPLATWTILMLDTRGRTLHLRERSPVRNYSHNTPSAPARVKKTEIKARRLFPRPVMNCLDNVVALQVAMLETPPVPFCRAVILPDLNARKVHTGNSALTPSAAVTRSSASWSPRHTLNISLVQNPELRKHPEGITADRNKRSLGRTGMWVPGKVAGNP